MRYVKKGLRVARATALAVPFAAALTGCAGTTGIYPVGPGLWTVSEFRAPALGGAAEARRVVELEASGFCAQWGLAYAPVAAGASGYAGSPYGPVSYAATFRCVPPAPPPARPGN
jgi:hypothetical protein